MTIDNLNFTRRQALAGLAASAAVPLISPFSQSFALSSEESSEPSSASLRGAYMILSTPYTQAGEVDYEDLAGEVAYLERCGVQGLVWPQNSSEQRYLSKEERLRGFDVIAEASKGRDMVLILGVQAADTEGMLEYARHAEALEPDGMIAIPPTTATSLEDFRRYYGALCSVTDRPVFVQTSGGPDIVLTIDFLVSLAQEFPQCAYIKEEFPPVQQRMLELAKYRPNPIKSIFGANFGRAWKYEMRLGTDGVMTGGAMYADIYAHLWQFHLDGRQDELRDCFSKLLLMLNLDATIPGVRLYILQKRGVFKTILSRRGEYTFSQAAIDEMEDNFAALKPYLKT